VPGINGRQWLDPTSLDEISKGGLADPHVTADLMKLDPAFRDQAADKSRLGPETPGCFLYVQQDRCRALITPSLHAALPVAEG
jgi:hypothetical protein